MSLLITVLTGLGNGLVDLLMLPWTIWQWFGMEVLKERMVALTLAGKSLEFLYMMLALVLVLMFLGALNRRFLVGTVLSLEALNRTVGQFASWFVLLLMIQQVMIIVMGQVFRGNELLFAPFGMQLSNAELQWLSGQLKFYNAILISFASAYTFIEGGHVRVDLVYGNLGYRAKRIIDFLGSLVFMLPATILLWWFAWPLATNAVFAQRPMNIFSDKASWRGIRLESSGTAEFTWVWAFKVLILFFAALLFIQAVAFMLRNLWALLSRDGEIESHPSDPTDRRSEDTDESSDTNANNVDIHLGKPQDPQLSLAQTSASSSSTLTAANESQSVTDRQQPRYTGGMSIRKEHLVSSSVSARQRTRVTHRRRGKPGTGMSTPSLAPAGASKSST